MKKKNIKKYSLRRIHQKLRLYSFLWDEAGHDFEIFWHNFKLDLEDK